MTISTRVGRPRDAGVSSAVAGAVISLLREVGSPGSPWTRLRRGRVSKASIYRRWASKEELLVDVIANLASENPVPDTGHIRDDLVELLHRMEASPKSKPGRYFPEWRPRSMQGASSGVVMPSR